MNALASLAAATFAATVPFLPVPQPNTGEPDAVAAIEEVRAAVNQDCSGEAGCGELLAQARKVLGDTDETIAALRAIPAFSYCGPNILGTYVEGHGEPIYP